MRSLLLPFLGLFFLLFVLQPAGAQLQITNSTDATALAQKIAGEGVTISNVTLTGGAVSSGFFKNIGGTNIALDSGVVLTCGRAASTGFFNGLNGNGFSTAASVNADNSVGVAGDADLANALGIGVGLGRDACVLEFDFVPVGDTIRFNYVFSSEEYNPEYVCLFNDAFAFFISGPGITGTKNIALVPNTNTPVSIFNVNNVQDPFQTTCPNNPQYYVNNENNVFFNHDGHTVTMTAISAVEPCERYHLKLVIMDVGDDQFDSGVFLEAGSLTSDQLKIDGHTPLNDLNLPYLAEGCVDGSIHIVRNARKPFPQLLNLTFGGTATNGVDVATIPSTVTIPAGDSLVVIPISAIQDMVNEGHETLKIYIGNACSSVVSDSLEIELRDVDLLQITPLDSARICRTNSIQLETVPGYINYDWTNAGSLSSNGISNPLATPVTDSTNYICTATIGDCIARDSVLIRWKTITLIDKADVLCNSGNNGSISVSGTGWEGAASFALNNGAFQSSGTFSGLGVGSYWVKVTDASGCMDSIQVDLQQEFPDVTFTTAISNATCSVTPDGRIEVNAAGGNGSYSYSLNGTSYQSSNVLIVPEGTHSVFVRDGNNCIASQTGIVVGKVNTIVLAAPDDDVICEGTSKIITATSNTSNITWSPAINIINGNTLSPTVNPGTSTEYFVTATLGTCTRTESVMINVWEAPVPNAGNDVEICNGITAQLNGGGGDEYSWLPSTTFVTATDIIDPVVKPATTTSYFLHVFDENGCKSLQPDEVVVRVTPAVEIFAGNDTLVAMDQPLQLGARELNGSGVTQWEWESTRFLDNPLVASPIAIFTEPFPTSPYEYTYTVTGTTAIGCQGMDEIKIKVYKGPEIYVPTAFTPNGDGKNDVLMALPVGIKELKYFRVFNRWGQSVFFTKDASKGWNGYIGGSDQSNSVYVWTAEGIDYMGNQVIRKGTTLLIR